MINNLILLTVLFVSSGLVCAQNPARPGPSPSTQTRRATPFELSDYGVQVQADARVIIMMAALDAAGFDPTPAGKEPSAFRRLVRRDQETLDPNLRERLRNFFERNKLPAPATVSDLASRYFSLAYAIGQPPLLDAPQRSDELPGGVLEVLDF